MPTVHAPEALLDICVPLCRAALPPINKREFLMPRGKLKCWIAHRGFGFLRPEGGGKDIFVHLRDLLIEPSELRGGDWIEFELTDCGDGHPPRAINVRWAE
jgi:cold shock CspA family protein